MWVFLRDAMFSIVEHHRDDSLMVVRSRIKEDLARVFDRHRIYENTSSDYRFRVFVLREEVAQILHDEVLGIDYTNFKASVDKDDKLRSWAYGQVWKTMNEVQVELYGHQDYDQWWLNYRDVQSTDDRSGYDRDLELYQSIFGDKPVDKDSD